MNLLARKSGKEKKMVTEIWQPDNDPFGIGGIDFSVRIPERSELFDEEEARIYIEGCDYPESVDDFLLALEVRNMFGPEPIRNMRVLDAMCGPGRLGREFLAMGANSVTFHDGHATMIEHARTEAENARGSEQTAGFVVSDVESVPLPDNSFDLVVCHNATHQLSDVWKLGRTMSEFLRLTAPGGHVIVADYQRPTTPELVTAANDRLLFTAEGIVPLLIHSFRAAFSKEEFAAILGLIPEIAAASVSNAQSPVLSEEMSQIVEADPIKGHLMDFSPISQRLTIRKAEK